MKKYSRAYVEITNICNRSCSFCPGTKREARMMSPEEFSTVAERIRPVTDYVYLHVMGEPLLHPGLVKIINIAHRLGFKCAITTNGTLLKDVMADLLVSPLYKINISLHSFEDGTEGEHEKYIKECAEAADALSEAGVLTVLRLWNVGCDGGRNNRTLSILKEHFAGCEWTEGARGARIRHKLHLEYADRFAWPDMAADRISDEVFCYGLGDHFGILSDGRVVPCCLDREGAVTLGNIYDTPIEDILTSERAVAIREGFLRRCAVEELCRRCAYARRFG